MIVEKIYEAKERKIKQYPVNANRASELGHECLRYLVLNRTRWQEKTMHDVHLQLIFDMGRVVEDAVQSDLREAGFNIIEQQRSFRWDKYHITGNIDMKLALDEALVKSYCQNGALPQEVKDKLMAQLLSRMNDRATAVVPTEIKSAAPNPFASINSVQDMLRHKYHYMRKYPAQLTLYLLMDGKDVGLFLFKNKSTGDYKEIWVALDYDFAESLVQKAELINLHVENETLPECMPYNEDICDECAFVHICLPDRIGKEVEISDSTELLDLVTRYMELKPGAKEYDEVNNRITKIVEGKDKVLIGDYFIEGKYIDRTSYDVPKDIKEQYKKVTQCWLKNIMKV